MTLSSVSSGGESPEARAREMLAQVYRPEGVEIWLAGAKRQFNGERPIDLIQRGEHDRVFAAIERLIVGAM